MIPSTVQFQADLKEFVQTLEAFENLSFLDQYDYSMARVHLVASVPGVFAGNKLTKYGHMRMRKLLGQ